MDRGAVIETLRRHEPTLKAAGVVHLHLFGSVARGEESAGSDIDLIAELDPTHRRTLVGMARLENMMSDILRNPVDLAIFGTLREPVRTRAEREGILAF